MNGASRAINVPMFEPRHSLFSIVAPQIKNVLVRATIANTLQNAHSIQHTIHHARSNGLVGGKGFRKEVEQELYRIQALRWTLRKFLLRWLFRRLKVCSTTDIVTLEPIKTPIYIVDWISRHIHSFETFTLHRDISCALSHSIGMFADPLRPRNPLTNIPLSLAQIISIWNTLACARIPLSSVVTNYRSVQFNHERFIEEYSTPLSLSCMKRCIMNPLDDEGIEYLIDFIEMAYTFNSFPDNPYYIEKIRSAINAHKNNEIISEFRRKCIEYNYVLITMKKNNALDLMNHLEKVYISCIPIIRAMLKPM